MRMKYYLRGIGIGIVVTTVILTIAYQQNQKQTMTDEQVIERARQLGMVEGNSASSNGTYKTIADLVDEADNNSTDNNKQQDTSTDSEKKQQQTAKKKTVEIVIKGGDSSNSVAQKCEDAGLVKDASAFNQYLISQGYDSVLQPGTYTIQMGSTRKQIANIITKK